MEKEEILSIVDATCREHTQAPLWYKSDVLRYMQEYADQETAKLREENEKLKSALSASERFRMEDAAGANEEIGNWHTKCTRLQSSLQAAEEKVILLNNDLNTERDRANKNRSIIDDIQKKDSETIALLAEEIQSLSSRVAELEGKVGEATSLITGIEHALMNTRPRKEWDEYYARMKKFIEEND